MGKGFLKLLRQMFGVDEPDCPTCGMPLATYAVLNWVDRNGHAHYWCGCRTRSVWNTAAWAPVLIRTGQPTEAELDEA